MDEPQHKQNLLREKSLRRFWSRRRDHLRLYGQAESRGFYERLDGFADAGVHSREPTAENKASHFQTFRRLWFKPLATAKTPRRQKCHLGVLVEATGFAPLAARPRRSKANFAGVRLWQTPRFFAPAPPFPANLLLCKIFAGALPSAHRAVQLAPYFLVFIQFARKPLALRSRLHPQIPSMFVTTKKRADRSQLPFSWSRRRDDLRLYG